MDEIVKEIRTIKHLVALAAFSILVYVLATLAQTMFAFRMMEPHNSTTMTETMAFRGQADGFIDERKYDELLKLASDQVKKQPDDANGYYYLGLAHYYKAEYNEAIASLNQAAQLAPTWRETITPYLDAAQKAIDAGSKEVK